jgi:transposase-like protein
MAKKLEQLLSYNNEVWIIGERRIKQVHTTGDTFTKHDKYEDDIFSTLLAIQKTKRLQQCWEVSEISNDTDTDYETVCTECGYCKNCKTCIACGKSYVPKIVHTKDGNQSRYTCPHCQSKLYKDTRIEKFNLQNGKPVCPYCNSDHVSQTVVESINPKCHKCNGLLASPKKINIWKLVVARQKRNYIQTD